LHENVQTDQFEAGKRRAGPNEEKPWAHKPVAPTARVRL